MDYIEEYGCALFERVCAADLEGIVAKRRASLYRATERPSADGVKIKNPAYSQAEGREELFERQSITASSTSQSDSQN